MYILEKKLHGYGPRRVVQTAPASSFASGCIESPVQNPALSMSCIQSGLSLGACAGQENKDKSKRPTHSAGATLYSDGLNLPKTAGKYGIYLRNVVEL